MYPVAPLACKRSEQTTILQRNEHNILTWLSHGLITSSKKWIEIELRNNIIFVDSLSPFSMVSATVGVFETDQGTEV